MTIGSRGLGPAGRSRRKAAEAGSRRGARRAPEEPRLLALAIGSLGVVFGDIGTSPLYAFRSALTTMQGEAVRRADIYGIVALALWALIMVVTVKYVLFLMRADNKGEGGVLSLMALAQRAIGRRTPVLFTLGADRRGAVLRRRCDHAGDLGAVGHRGPAHHPQPAATRSTPRVVDAISVAILLALFFVQSRGTARVGALLRPDHAALVPGHRHAGRQHMCSTTRACCSRSTRSTASAS